MTWGNLGPHILHYSHSEAEGTGDGTAAAAAGNGDSSSDCCNHPSTAVVVVAVVDNSPAHGNGVVDAGKDVDSAVDWRLFSLPPPEVRPPKT